MVIKLQYQGGIQLFENQTIFNGNVVVWCFVKDLSASVDWYTNILGIKPSNNIDVAYFFPINENTKLAISNRFKASDLNVLPKSVALDLQSDHVFETHSLLKEKGVQVLAIENPVLNYHEFYFKDLDDNLIRVHGFA
ncbi:hypothetical protein GI482_14085 [Bacillus sp. N3536]|nr:hypothetical protein GI482_14085 [Bacillus sp. N3536]